MFKQCSGSISVRFLLYALPECSQNNVYDIVHLNHQFFRDLLMLMRMLLLLIFFRQTKRKNYLNSEEKNGCILKVRNSTISLASIPMFSW